jgi:hypothetical protein
MEIHLIFRHLTHTTELQPSTVRPSLLFLLILQDFLAVRRFRFLVFGFLSGFFFRRPSSRMLFPCSFTTDFDAYLAPGCEEWCKEQIRQLNLPRPPCADDFLLHTTPLSAMLLAVTTKMTMLSLALHYSSILLQDMHGHLLRQSYGTLKRHMRLQEW